MTEQTAAPEKTEITVETAEKNLKDAVENLRAEIIKQKGEPESKLTESQKADHWLNKIKPIFELADVVKDAQDQLKIANAKKHLAELDFDEKLAALGLTKEDLAAQLGLTIQTQSEQSVKSSKKDKTMIPFRYMDKNGEIKDGVIADTGHVTGNTGHTPEVVEYWNKVSPVKFERTNAKDPTKKVQEKRKREEIITLTDEEIIRDYKDIITKAA